MNDVKLFTLVDAGSRDAAKELVDEAFAFMGKGFVNFDARWSNDKGTTHTSFAAELPVSTEIVTRFSLALIYRGIYDIPVAGDGITEEFIDEDFVARYDAEGRVIALLFVHKMKVDGEWFTIHDRNAILASKQCAPYWDVPPI